jgi:amino acid permease
MFAYLRDRKFLHATAVMVATMVGVGIFGIPFAFAKAGFLVGAAWLIALAIMTGLYDLMFAELTLRTSGIHQISGYASVWLGPWARRVSFLGLMLSGYGTLLAYMIIAGEFLHNILSQYIAVNPDLYSIGFAVTWSLLVFVRLRTVAAVDLFMMCLFGAMVVVIAAFGASHIQWGNLQDITSAYWFLPYGIIMFALSGANAVPIQRELLAGREKLLRPAIITAVAVVSAMYLLFAFIVVGVSGDVTSPEALAGLYALMGPSIVVLGSFFGVMTISTSFLMMGTALYETFHIDYQLRALTAWFLVIVPPVVFFWSGLRNFIDVIGLVGSVSVGLLAIVTLAAYTKARRVPGRNPEFTLPMPSLAVWVLMSAFAVGIIYSLIFT